MASFTSFCPHCQAQVESHGLSVTCLGCGRLVSGPALLPATISVPPSPAATLSVVVHTPEPQTIPFPVAPQPLTDEPLLPLTVPMDGSLPARIGRFEIRQRLGEGAFGVVYRAYDPQLDREVALKVAKPHTLNTEARVKRFLREAKAAANLRHPNIVPVFDSGQDGEQYYIASAFIPGKPLADVLEEQPEGNGLEMRRAVEIIRRLAEALTYAHSKGVIHRDIKPANAMLDDQGEPLLLDFGLAARAEGDEKLTQEATMMGTPAYMAPEQAAGKAEAASDQYSLGCTLYELLTGQTPFGGPLEMQLVLHQTQEPPSPRKFLPKLPRDLETICLKCLAKKPEERYSTCRELADDLRRWLEGEPITARRWSMAERLLRWVKKEPKLAGAVALAVSLLVIVGVVLVVSNRTTQKALNDMETAQRERALSQVKALLDANPQAVPTIIDGLKPFRDTVDPHLRELLAQPDLTEAHRVRVSLALLPVDPSQVKYLSRRLLEASPEEGVVIRDALQDHKKDLLADLWAVLESPNPKRDAQRLQAAAALALYDSASPRWDKVSASVVAQLVKENPVYLGTWLTAFRQVKMKLAKPLADVFADHRDERTAERAIATSLLDDYATDQPDLLANLLMDADEEQFAKFFPKVEAERGRLVSAWNQMVTVPLASQEDEADKERLAKRQANAGVALLRVGATEKVWPLLQEQSDPRTRSYLIHRLVPFAGNRRSFESDPLSLILKRLDVEKEVSIRRALLLCVGELGLARLSTTERADLMSRKVLPLYRDEADAGVHGAAEWLLRKWQQEEKDKPDRITALEQEWVKKNQATRDEEAKQIVRELAPGQPRWCINSQGQTLVVIPGPVEFLMGSPTTESGRAGGPNDKTEERHQKRIARSFAIASKEVTVAQFLRFRKEKEQDYNKLFSPSADCPINTVTWYEATAYCNWLSKQEGIPEDQWCYEPNEQKQYGPGMKVAKDYLTRTGYRLPTGSEWEYACRAGALTSRHYGEAEDLLGQYAWYSKNSKDEKLSPVGSLKPNDLGLFDMYGNALEWCQEPSYLYKAGLDREDTTVEVSNNLNRVLRGGTFNFQASYLRSAYRFSNVPTYRMSAAGFRLARTFQ